MTDKSKKSFLKKLLKVTAWIVGNFLLVITSILLLIRLPSIQNQITQKAIRFVEEKIGTKVQLQNIYISFPKKIVLKGLYLEDQSKDTLLYVGQMSLDVDLWALAKNKIQLDEIKLSKASASISRQPNNDSYNFDYIFNVFNDSTSTETDEGNTWIFTLGSIDLSSVSISYIDDYLGNFPVVPEDYFLSNHRYKKSKHLIDQYCQG